MNVEITMQHGFKMLRRMHELKLAFDEGGPAGRISFAKACIWSGKTLPEEIIVEACAIAGDHLETLFDTLLMEGENIHWRKCAEGSLEVITRAE
jgi:hypothetical protein